MGKPLVAGEPKRLTVLGDSISNGADEWPGVFRLVYNGGWTTLLNHAVAGATIITDVDGDDDMAAQVVSATNDNADRIFILLGTSDDNAGDMEVLQAAYAAGLAALKTSNSQATIYAINLLPRWTDNTGAVEVDKGNIRTAISAAGVAQEVTVLDGYTGPGIVASDTLDGNHLTASGHEKLSDWLITQVA